MRHQLYTMGDEIVEFAVPFDGEDFDMWASYFKSFLDQQGLLEALDPVDGEVTPEMAEANSRAFSHMVLAMDDPKSQRIVGRAETEKYPEGDASEAWKRLREKWEPDLDVALTVNAFLSSKMKDASEDPEQFVVEKEKLRRQLSDKGLILSDSFLIYCVLCNLPSEYDIMKTKLLGMTIDSVKEELKKHFCKMQKQEKAHADGCDGSGRPKRFQGKCNYCGKRGHKSIGCYARKREEESKHRDFHTRSPGASKGHSRQFRGVCYFCDEPGHKLFECPKKQQMQSAVQCNQWDLAISGVAT